MSKKRADMLLVEKHLVSSRQQAQRLIEEGKVLADGCPVAKPATLLSTETNLKLLEEPAYVSRGGLKLEKAVEVFKVPVEGRLALDVGASTGGFTDYLLKNGASRVIAIDVGYGQFAWCLRNDPRVVLIERTNIRQVEPSILPYAADLAVVDLSFISLGKVVGSIVSITSPAADLIMLVKPQFEAEPQETKKGVVRNPIVQARVLRNVAKAAQAEGLAIKGITFSPIKGPQGNIEFFIYASKTGEGIRQLDEEISKVVDSAHAKLAEAGKTPENGKTEGRETG